MATKFLDHEAVHFVAGRIFIHDGKKYYPGEVIEDARSWKNLESMVRSRFFVAVSEDVSVLPPRLRKDVKTVEFARNKLSADRYQTAIEERDAEPVEVPDDEPAGVNPEWTIKQMLTYLDEHPQDIMVVLEVERSNKNRPRLITKIEERLSVPIEEEIDV